LNCDRVQSGPPLLVEPIAPQGEAVDFGRAEAVADRRASR